MKEIHANIAQRTLEAKNECRYRIDLLRSRIHLLTGTDRLLMTMHLERGNSIRQLARLTSVNDTMIARRIRKLTKRLLDGEYVTCLRNRNKFTKTEMAIAKAYFLTGLSMKEIAAEHHLTYYHTRQTVRKIRWIIAAIRQQDLVHRNKTGPGAPDNHIYD